MNRHILRIGRIGLSAPRYLRFMSDFGKFKRMARQDGRFSIKWSDRYPMIHDRTARHDFEPHYTYHPAWAARILSSTRPNAHVDISSTLSFATIISAFMLVHHYEFRPADIHLDNLESKRGDILSLPLESGSVESLSCMHVVEHIGLSRYGDIMDPEGDIKAIAELKRVLAKGGDLLYVVPVGRPKVMYNAHRIYSYEQVIEQFSDLKLEEFALIPDDQPKEGLIRNACQAKVSEQNYACGCFWFKKPQA